MTGGVRCLFFSVFLQPWEIAPQPSSWPSSPQPAVEEYHRTESFVEGSAGRLRRELSSARLKSFSCLSADSRSGGVRR